MMRMELSMHSRVDKAIQSNNLKNDIELAALYSIKLG